MIAVPDIIIAVDGCSSTGKSSFAKEVARTFGFLYLDSGALYRGVTLFAQEKGLISEDNLISDELEQALEGLDLHFGEGGFLYISQRCIESEIRGMKVSSQVSPISALSYVRDYVDERLHLLSSGGRVVMDGRDIGTTVFPHAELKIFMTARDEVRAKRRFDEMLAKGGNPVYEEVLANLKERDYIDSHRSVSPLRQADDAFVLDNSDMTMKEELSWIMGVIQGKFGILQ
ncbi:cytidylate kinase [Bacteroides sp. CAG:1060]|nr:cytidylate kinase [Bacteroides sp. CAG:1060]